jgi:hypothetical protein
MSSQINAKCIARYPISSRTDHDNKLLVFIFQCLRMKGVKKAGFWGPSPEEGTGLGLRLHRSLRVELCQVAGIMYNLLWNHVLILMVVRALPF